MAFVSMPTDATDVGRKVGQYSWTASKDTQLDIVALDDMRGIFPLWQARQKIAVKFCILCMVAPRVLFSQNFVKMVRPFLPSNLTLFRVCCVSCSDQEIHNF